MYHLSTLNFSRSIGTLLEVLELFQNDKHFQFIEASDVSLSHAGQTLFVTKYNGRLTLRMSGKMGDLFLSMLDEIDGLYFRPHGLLLKPWEIRQTHWQLLFFAFELAKQPLYLFSFDQVQEKELPASTGGSLVGLLHNEAHARFGFGCAGPVVVGSGHVNSRHEVHLAYALAAGSPVPDAVLKDYLSLSEPFGNDIRWARPLLSVPEMRGAVPTAKLCKLVSVMTHSRQTISSANAAVLAMVARLLPNEPTIVEVDDLLYRHGLLEARAVPESYREPVDIGVPASPFAALLWQVTADGRKSVMLNRLDTKRAEGEIGQREYDLHRHLAALDHGRATFEYPNRMARAIQNADMHFLLEILDRLDDANRFSKLAICDFYGVKLIGVKAKARRRAIFALAGLDEAQQLQWELSEEMSKGNRMVLRDSQRAKARAELARYRFGDCVLTGVQHVEQAIASGFNKIVSHRYGASCRYSLVGPETEREARTLRANDGTLAYAQSLLSEQSQQTERSA